MLKILRENASSWLLKGILLLVAVTFISWGGSYLLREKKVTYAAKVNGTVIDVREYSDAYQNLIKQYRDALGPAFSDKMIEELKLKEKLMDDFINRILIIQEGKRLGITVSDEELRGMIQSVPAFQVNGQFDPRRYEMFLRQNRTTPEEFEYSQRERILMSRVINLVRQNGVKVSDQEVLDTYLYENGRINLSFIKVSPDGFKGQVSANEVEVKDYYSKNSEEFRTPSLYQVQYLAFRLADFEGKVQVSPDEIKRIYDSQKDRFKVPKQVKAREILIKVDPQDPADKIEAKKKKAEEILEKAKKAKDFGSLAKQYSESETASKGGDLGWVQKGRLEEAAETALFALKPGETSSVIIRPEGFAIFRAEDVREEKERSLEEVKEEIANSLKKEKAKAEASRGAEDAFYALFRTRDLENYAKEKGVPLKTTDYFKQGDEVTEFGRDPGFYSSVSSLKVGDISPVVNAGSNFYILKLLNKKDSRIPPLEEVKEEVTRKVVSKKLDEKAHEAASALLKQIQDGKDIREAAKANSYPVEETGFFTRTTGAIPKIGPIKEPGALLAPLTEKDPVPKDVFQTKDGYFVARLSSTEPADQTRFAAAEKGVEARLINQKQEEFFQNWIKELRSRAKIDINPDVVKS